MIGCALMIVAGCAGSGDAPTGPAAANSKAVFPEHYLVFFDPNQSQLDAEGQAIVREAVAAIEERGPIEILVPTKAPDIVECRYAAIQNIISASGMDTAPQSRVVLASGGINLPGADDRAEIGLIP